MKAPLSLLLAATLLAAPAAAQDMADSVVDKSTKRAYPVHIQAGTTDQVHTLTGIGVRTRTMLNIKVYAIGSWRYRVHLGPDAETHFQVSPVSTEWQDTSPDFDLLEELATRTGGAFYRTLKVGVAPNTPAGAKAIVEWPVISLIK